MEQTSEAFEKGIYALNTIIAVLRNEVDNLKLVTTSHLVNIDVRVDNIIAKINNGFSNRLTENEHNLELLRQSVATNSEAISGFRGFVAKIALGLAVTAIIGAYTGYSTMQSRAAIMEKQMEIQTKQIDYLARQMGQKEVTR